MIKVYKITTQLHKSDCLELRMIALCSHNGFQSEVSPKMPALQEVAVNQRIGSV